MSGVLKPPRLKEGDCVAVVAPSSPPKKEMLERGVLELERIGFRVSYRPDILSSFRYLAGDDRRRTDEINQYLHDPEARALFSARGGYGAFRILAGLDDRAMREDPKPFVGFSDATAIHLYAWSRLRLTSIYGPMVSWDIRQGEAKCALNLLKKILTEPLEEGEITFRNLEVLREGRARGILLGGCLSVLNAAVGTSVSLDTTGKILFLEDADLKPFQLDRILTQWLESGLLKDVGAVVFGEMVNCVQHPDQGYTLSEVIVERLGNLDCPVLSGLPSGHVRGKNYPLPLGVQAEIKGDSLIINEGVVT